MDQAQERGEYLLLPLKLLHVDGIMFAFLNQLADSMGSKKFNCLLGERERAPHLRDK